MAVAFCVPSRRTRALILLSLHIYMYVRNKCNVVAAECTRPASVLPGFSKTSLRVDDGTTTTPQCGDVRRTANRAAIPKRFFVFRNRRSRSRASVKRHLKIDRYLCCSHVISDSRSVTTCVLFMCLSVLLDKFESPIPNHTISR